MKAYHLLLISSVLFLSSCLRSETNIGKRFELLYYSPDIGQHINFGDDSVRVTDIKFIVSDFTLTNEDGIVLQTAENITALLYDYDLDAFGDRIIISTEIGFEINNFVSFGMNIDPVDDNDPLFDTDFFGNTTNYSLIIVGSVNDEDFIIRSSSSFDLNWDFDEPVILTDVNETIFLRSLISIEEVFRAEDGSLLDPTDNADIPQIVSNFGDNLGLLPFADSIFQ